MVFLVQNEWSNRAVPQKVLLESLSEFFRAVTRLPETIPETFANDPANLRVVMAEYHIAVRSKDVSPADDNLFGTGPAGRQKFADARHLIAGMIRRRPFQKGQGNDFLCQTVLRGEFLKNHRIKQVAVVGNVTGAELSNHFGRGAGRLF